MSSMGDFHLVDENVYILSLKKMIVWTPLVQFYP